MKLHRIAASSLALTASLALPATAFAGTAAQDSSLSAQDKAFLVAAHQSNLAEIAAGKAAQQEATTAAVRDHGSTFIADHTRLDASLQKVAAALSVDLPSAPNPAQRSTLASVKAKSGRAFDSAWVATQITSHRASKAAGATEIAAGSNPQVVGPAKSAAPVIQSHLSMLLSTAPAVGVNAGEGGSQQGSPALGLVLGGLAVTAAGAYGLRRRTVTA